MESPASSSVPASPRFEWSKIGSDWAVDGTTVIASGMMAEERCLQKVTIGLPSTSLSAGERPYGLSATCSSDIDSAGPGE